MAQNFPTNAPKSFINGNCHSNKSINHAKVVLDNKVPIRPTWALPLG
jgi:hypothetical protein